MVTHRKYIYFEIFLLCSFKIYFNFIPFYYILYLLMHEYLIIVDVKNNSFREGCNAVVCFCFVLILCGNQ